MYSKSANPGHIVGPGRGARESGLLSLVVGCPIESHWHTKWQPDEPDGASASGSHWPEGSS
eukprot:1149341-Rhodomonas_salina.2